MKKFLAVLCALAMALSMAACGAGPKAEDTVEAFCKALSQMDFEAMDACVEGEFGNASDLDLLSSEGEMYDAFLGHLKDSLAKLQYVIGDVSEEEDSATVSVDFTYVDAAPIVADAMANYIVQAFALALSDASEDEISDLLITSLNDSFETVEPAQATASVTFNCIKQDDAWQITKVPVETADIISCGIVKAIEEAFDGE